MSRGLRFRDWHLDLNAAGVPRAPEVSGWAPFFGTRECCDPEGRWRSRHVFDGDSVCLFCNREDEMAAWSRAR